MMRKIFKIGFLPLVLAGCLGNAQITDPGYKGQPSTLVIHVIGASSTDPQITTPNGSHITALDTGKTALNKVVIFLGGTASAPSAYQTVLRTVVSQGYHVISLNYYNEQAVGALALDDLSEYGKIRKEIIYGTDDSSKVSVSASNSICNRIKKLLVYLSDNFPAEGWTQYLNLGEVNWANVVLSGYSQGAGHAAYLAKDFGVSKVVLFSGVVDGKVTEPRASADWVNNMASSSATGLNNFWFFESINDGNYPSIKTNLAALGYDPGPDNNSLFVGNVDLVPAPYGGRHVLLTAQVTGASAHPSTCEDSSTPVINGIPLYQEVWKTLFP